VEVRDISLYGAYIVAADSFYSGTLLRVVLANNAKANSHVCICGQVRRKTKDGFCVAFLFGSSRERRLLREFLKGVKQRGDEVQSVALGKTAQQNEMEPSSEVRTIGKDRVDVGETKGATGALAEAGGNGPIDRRDERAEAANMADRKQMSRSRERGRRYLKGQALIEMALILPLLLLLIVNVVNFGGLLYAWITVSNAARAGAQYYITGAATLGAPARPAVSAVQTLVMNDLKALPNASTSQVCLSSSVSATVTCNIGTAPSSAPPPAETAEGSPPVTFAVAAVDVKYTYTPFIPLWDFPRLSIHATLTSTDVHRQAVMRILQ
jgi:Flp pilus assembly protein TadG